MATAVAAGSDAVMLSAETAVGEYPIRATEVMSEICAEMEKELLKAQGDPAVPYITAGGGTASAVARSAVGAAHNLGVDTVVAFTESGSTARLLSKYRPRGPHHCFHSRGPRVATGGPLPGSHPPRVRPEGPHRPDVRNSREDPGEGGDLSEGRPGGDGGGDPSQPGGFHQPVQGPDHRRAVSPFLRSTTKGGRSPELIRRRGRRVPGRSPRGSGCRPGPG